MSLSTESSILSLVQVIWKDINTELDNDRKSGAKLNTAMLEKAFTAVMSKFLKERLTPVAVPVSVPTTATKKSSTSAKKPPLSSWTTISRSKEFGLKKKFPELYEATRKRIGDTNHFVVIKAIEELLIAEDEVMKKKGEKSPFQLYQDWVRTVNPNTPKEPFVRKDKSPKPSPVPALVPEHSSSSSAPMIVPPPVEMEVEVNESDEHDVD